MQKERKSLGSICPNKMGPLCRRAKKKGMVLMPRSSSPEPVFVDKMQCVVEQAFATIAWDDLDDCASVLHMESDSLGSQVNESDGDEQYFGEYALDFMAESPGTLDSSLSPVGLVPFQGCIIPPLTPRQDFPPQDSPTAAPRSPEPGHHSAQDGATWRGMAKHQGWLLDHSAQVNHRLHETLHSKQEEVESLQERNGHLRELASRAKHLASVLERLMTVSGPYIHEPALPSCDKSSSSPHKRRRLSEDAEGEGVPSGSVEDILRDMSTRCNAVLHGSGAVGPGEPQASDHVRMYGAFAGLQTSVAEGSGGALGVSADGTDSGCDSSFRTSIQDHCTIKTQVFPHGHAFTSRTQTGGYRFRWVPNQS
ncbi:multicilin isoform X1 [Gadus chalcogrammus]|uniref:multicilin isoform X1 n=2 Tax=Gadus chalcogrammus TaxID=1042646 RepID=UPI0024C4E4DD|nr:multicilin isoform X1 [Gadus chalcogrammus]